MSIRTRENHKSEKILPVRHMNIAIVHTLHYIHQDCQNRITNSSANRQTKDPAVQKLLINIIFSCQITIHNNYMCARVCTMQ